MPTTTTANNRCRPTPTIVSEKTWPDPRFAAANALVDARCDVRTPATANYWAGHDMARSGFVIDLGCELTIGKVYLRNSHNGFYFNS